MGQFFRIVRAFEEAIFETGYDNDWYNQKEGIITEEEKQQMLKLIMKKTKGTCNPKQIRKFIEMEYSI